MQKNYLKEAEKKLAPVMDKTPEKPVSQRRADEYFKGECRSRDVSKSPTASFHRTKSSKWIENFTSTLDNEPEIVDHKA